MTKEPTIATRRSVPASPHLVDLAAPARAREAVEAAARRETASRNFIHHLLNERIHLRDVRHRRVSTHILDWRDFPPKHARSLPHAIAITARRFFTEHPLAELTIFTVLHLAAVVALKLVIRPIERAFSNAADTVEAVTRPTAATISTMSRSTGSIMAAAPVAAAVAPAKDIIIAASRASEGILTMHDAMTLLGLTESSAVIDEKRTPAQNSRPFWSLPRLDVSSFTPSFSFAMPAAWGRNVLGFALSASIVMLPFGSYDLKGGLRLDIDAAKERGRAAVAMLKAAETAARSLDFVGAGSALAAASDDFDAARKSLGAIGSIMNAAASALPVETRLTSAAPLLLAGQEAARGGAELAAGLAGLDDAASPLAKLRLARAAVDSALPHFDVASEAISKVAPGIAPEAYRADIERAKTELPRLAAALHTATDGAAILEDLMGASGMRRYLVAFQNDSELRPTGGFMGSFALLDVKDGEIVAMDIPGGGSYDLQGSLSLRLNAPQPLRLINPRWEFQDANWYPDFPASSEILTRFHEKSGGPTVDGVIAINATFMEKLLAVTGPIEMPEYGKTITAQNFFYETQRQVEVDYDKTENKPKKFISDLAPKMIERLKSLDRSALMDLASLMRDGLKEKRIQLWSRDAKVQERLAALGWDGAMRSGDGDFLGVVHTNIAGQKTDLVMSDKIEHAAKIDADGSAIVTLALARTHGGQDGAAFSGVRNVDYVRVYVPRGAELLEARGFTPPDPKLFSIADSANSDDPAIAAEEAALRTDPASGTRVSEEHGLTVFGNWIMTDPGKTTRVTLVYRLPPGTAKLEARTGGALSDAYARLIEAPRRRLNYELRIFKQSGLNPPEFESTVDLPREFIPVTVNPERRIDERGRLVFNQVLLSDGEFHLTAESQ